MADETRIIKIEVDQAQALKDLEATESALLDLKNQQKELNDSLKAGTITQQEYVAGKVQLDNKIKQETDNRKTLTQAINTESNSLAAQKLKLKELITERDKIDRSTVEGAKKFDQMNGSILKLNGSIKDAEAQGGSFQRNVGNYKGTIDQFTGGAYSAAQGLGAMVKASLAFIATPIGAVIAAIGLALGALMAYFKGSEEGQNRLNKIMAVGSAVMEKIMDVAEDLGEAIFNAFTNPKKAMVDLFNFVKDNIINRFTAFAVILEGITTLDFKKVANGVLQAGTGVENVIDKVEEFGKEASKTIDKAVKDGQRLADMNAKLLKDERKLLEDGARRKLEISELRRKADEAEGQNKLDFLNQALELEKVEAEQQLANAQLKRDIAAEEVTLNGDTTEALDKQAQAEADLNNAKAAFFENTRKMNKERLSTEKLIDDSILKRIDSEELLLQKEQERVAKSLTINEDQLTKSLDNIDKKEKETLDSLGKIFEGIEDVAAADVEVNDAATDNYIENTKKRLKAEEDLAENIIKAVMKYSGFAEGAIIQLANLREANAENEIDLVNKQYGEAIAAEKARYDSGEITLEQFNEAKSGLEKEAAMRISEIRKKVFEDNKKAQIASAIISTVQAGIMAFAQLGPIAGAIAAAIVLALGYKQVDVIRDQQYVPESFSIGGYTGPGGVHDPAGIVHRGEVVWNQRDVAAVGGPNAANAMRPTYTPYYEGGIVAGGMTNQIDQQFMGGGQMPRVQLSLTELHSAENALAQKVEIVEA